MKNRADILRTLKAEIAREIGVPESDIDENATFHALGLNSISSVFILDLLERQLKIEMNPMVLWDYPTISLLADHLGTLLKEDE